MNSRLALLSRYLPHGFLLVQLVAGINTLSEYSPCFVVLIASRRQVDYWINPKRQTLFFTTESVLHPPIVAPPLGDTSRYYPPPSAYLFDFSVGFRFLIAMLVSGGISFPPEQIHLGACLRIDCAPRWSWIRVDNCENEITQKAQKSP